MTEFNHLSYGPSSIDQQLPIDESRTTPQPYDLLSQLDLGRQKYGDAFTVNMYGLRCTVVSHPQDIRRVFTDGNFREKGPIYEGVRQIIGNGILTSDGEIWKANHRLVSPTFHRQQVAEMVNTIADVGKEYADDLRMRSEDGVTVDLQEEMTKLTLDTLGAVVFGRHANVLQGLSYNELVSTFKLAGKVGEKMDNDTQAQHMRIKQRLHGLSEELIHAARLDEPDSTLLSVLAHTRDADTNQLLDNKTIRNELLTIMFAGHETTALTLSWLFQLTQSHPEVRVNMQREAQTVLQGDKPSISDIGRLTFTRQVIDETLRLRPPVPITARSVKTTTTLRGIDMEAGEGVLPFIWGAHRHEEFWTNPDRFNPLRFSPENVKKRDKWSYLPFAAGNRICIGQSLALTELAIHSALLMQAVEVQTVDDVPPKINMTLRPSSSIHAQVQPARL